MNASDILSCLAVLISCIALWLSYWQHQEAALIGMMQRVEFCLKTARTIDRVISQLKQRYEQAARAAPDVYRAKFLKFVADCDGLNRDLSETINTLERAQRLRKAHIDLTLQLMSIETKLTVTSASAENLLASADELEEVIELENRKRNL